MKRSIERIKRRTAGLVLAASMGVSPIASLAAPPTVETDETLYVNLDHYGKAELYNVVKGCSPKGGTTITDYGVYETIENMSGSETPVVQDGKVTWQIPEDWNGRFYYKGRMAQDSVILPWDLDISYTLNGVPTGAEELAGASGVVEIQIHAIPREDATEYYRNNMLLMTAIPADRSDYYSVEAEGAQVQSLGNTTAVLFTALPGEEGTYKVRLGSDCFETTGVIFSMVPGTVEDLEHIRDLKEAKDTWRAAGDEMYDSLEQMARSVESMRDGVGRVQQGLNAAEQARQTISGAKDSILDGNDQALSSMREFSAQLETMIPHLQTLKESAETVHTSMEFVSENMKDMETPLNNLYDRLRGISSTTESMGEQLPELTEDIGFLIRQNAEFQANVAGALGNMAALIELMDEEGADSDEAILYDLDPTVAAMEMLGKISSDSEQFTRVASNFLDDVSDASRYTGDVADHLNMTVQELAALRDSLSLHYPELQESIDDTSALIEKLTGALNQGISTLTVVQNTMRNSSGSLDQAARDSLSGSMELFDKSLDILDSTSALRQAGERMKSVMDQELDRYETENRFLYLDPSAPKESFTSKDNPEPKTLQVVLRSEEISLDDREHEVLDMEKKEEDVGPFRRMILVISRIWEAIRGIFSELG